MAVSNFEELCKGYCEIAGVQAPELAEDTHGLTAFHHRIREVTVTVAKHRSATDAAFVIAEFGPVPQGHEAKIWNSLLTANHELVRQRSGGYSRNPGNHDVLFQFGFRLDTGSPLDLYRAIEQVVDEAGEWRAAVAALPLPESVPSRPRELDHMAGGFTR